jgi:CO dehydrogenase/acetyl-CoA synthase beta subunit
METKEKVKTFDAVKMMREIRDKISDETQAMTLEQLKKYIADRLKQSHLKTIGR